jgi:hypothetical protein
LWLITKRNLARRAKIGWRRCAVGWTIGPGNIHATVSEIVRTSRRTNRKAQLRDGPRTEDGRHRRAQTRQIGLLHTRLGRLMVRRAGPRRCTKTGWIQCPRFGADTEIDAGNAETVCVCFLSGVGGEGCFLRSVAFPEGGCSQRDRLRSEASRISKRATMLRRGRRGRYLRSRQMRGGRTGREQ